MVATSQAAGTAFGNPDDELDNFAPQGAGAAFDLDALDLSGVVADRGFTPIPPGIYDARIDDCTFAFSQANNPQWVWSVEVTMPETGRTRKVRHYTPLIPDQLPRFKAIIEAVAGDDIDMANINVRGDAALMKGRYCRVRIAADTNRDGSPGQKITRFMPAAEQGNANFL